MTSLSYDIHELASDTIIAECTPAGRAAVSIVRLSGSDAIDIASTLNPAIAKQPPRHACLRKLHQRDLLLDDALVTIFRAPHSYTGEDVVEISLHGNPLIVRNVISALIEAGARSAGPGEFTRRAYLNGRLPLVRAEAVAQLIHAGSEAALRAARRLYEGGLEKRLEEIRAAVLATLAEVEALIDFVEEDIEPRELSALERDCRAAEQKIRALLRSLAQGRILTEGINVALAGLPNAGKSSLLNALAGRDRAIVAPTPGTTRDTVEISVEWDGLAVRLTDTAGLRDTDDPVEREGVRRSRAALQAADIILWISDATLPASDTTPPEDIASSASRLIRVFNKCDLLPNTTASENHNNNTPQTSYVRVSALTGEGLDQLRATIKHTALGAGQEDADAMTVHEHHRAALQHAADYLQAAADALHIGTHLDLCAIDLRSAIEAVGSITRRVDNEELLGDIFSRFCIGK